MMDSADSGTGGALAEAEGGWVEESCDAASDSSAVATSTTEDAAVAVLDDAGRWPALF